MRHISGSRICMSTVPTTIMCCQCEDASAGVKFFQHVCTASQNVVVEWHDSNDLEEALTASGSHMMAAAPQEMVLIEKRGPGTLSDDVDASSAADGSDAGGGDGNYGGSFHKGGSPQYVVGGSRRSLLQPPSVSSSYGAF